MLAAVDFIGSYAGVVVGAGLTAEAGAIVAGAIVGGIGGAIWGGVLAAQDKCYGASCGQEDDEWGLKICSTGECVIN